LLPKSFLQQRLLYLQIAKAKKLAHEGFEKFEAQI